MKQINWKQRPVLAPIYYGEGRRRNEFAEWHVDDLRNVIIMRNGLNEIN